MDTTDQQTAFLANNGSTGSSKKTTLILVIVVLVIAIGVALYFYFQGKAKGSTQTNLNLSSPLDSSGNAPVASEAEIRQLAEQLHDDMDGLNVWGHDNTVWNNFMALGDPDIIRVNNQFNAQYQAESGESFVEWVDNESGSYSTQAKQRLKKLNLS